VFRADESNGKFCNVARRGINTSVSHIEIMARETGSVRFANLLFVCKQEVYLEKVQNSCLKYPLFFGDLALMLGIKN